MSKIANIDRRIMYLLLVAVIAFALIRPVGLAIKVSPETMKVYNAIAALPETSIIWMGFEFDAGAIPELMPAAKMVIREAFDRNLKIVAGGMWQMAGDVTNQAFDAVLPDCPNKQYGVDYVSIGYRPGRDVWLDQMTRDAWAASANQDYKGTKFADLPLMSQFKSLKDAKFLMVFSTGTPSTPEYIKVASGPLANRLASRASRSRSPEPCPTSLPARSSAGSWA
jgi:hypothetical protein